MKNSKNSLLIFFGGLAMLAAGLYWLFQSVEVHGAFSGGYVHFGGGMNVPQGLVIVPFIVGIVWLFVNFDSFGAKIMTGIGVVIIVAAIIMSIQFHFVRKSLFEYLIMIIFIFGGAAMVLRVLCYDPDKQDKNKKK